MMKAKNSANRDVFPEGWDAARVQRVIDHYENQTFKERVCEIENAAILDAWERLRSAIKEFNHTNQSKLVPDKLPDQRHEEKIAQAFGGHRFCRLNWSGPDHEGHFNSWYDVETRAENLTQGPPFRPVVCKISTKIAPPATFPRSNKTVAELMAVCACHGVTLQSRLRKTGLMITGLSVTTYAKSLDAETLEDCLVRLGRAMSALRDYFGRRKRAS